MSKVIVHRHVVKYLQRLPSEAKDRIKDILKHLEKNPLNHPNIGKMAGEW
jgi:mRNA-degrading endonuclease RelE of RelBE toxin-antitoxin system